MHKIASIAAVAALTLVLAACGGSDDKSFVGGQTGGSSSSSSSSAAVSVSSVSVSSSTASIPADDSARATISAVVRDANNVAVSGVTVSFAASAGLLAVTQATTDANGTATATLSASGAAAGTSITVTATVGGVSGTATVSVVSTQQSITLLTSSPQIPSDDSTGATITAIVRDANNQLVPGVAVTFQTSSGTFAPVQTTAGAAGSPQVPAGMTDGNGQAQALVTTPGDPSNRNITVTASVASGATATITVAVVGTKLTVNGPTSLITGNSGSFTVALTDSGGNGISGQSVALSSASGNTLSAAAVTTDATGHASFQLTATKPGSDTVTASTLGLSATATVAVSSQSFAFTAPAADSTVPISTAQAITLKWTNGGAPVANTAVTFSTTRGEFSGNVTTTTVNTDATGAATVSISSTTAGPAAISATGQNVSAQLALTFVATTPASINVQASPATISTQGQSTITAIVRDAQNNLVQGATVDFQLTDKTGGSINTATATTDVQGQAQTVYTATSTASASNGVQITATVANTAIQGVTSLTVGGQTVFLSLGTGNQITENQAATQFSVPFVIQALDSAGHAVPGVAITLTVHSLPPSTSNSGSPSYSTDAVHGAYAKGSWFVTGGTPAWAQGNQALPNPVVYCLNEDVNGTGIYDQAADLNQNTRLDPGDVAAVNPGTVTTDSSGTANVSVTYPEDHALWVQVKLTATTTVNGTQSSTSSIFWLPMLASKLSSASVSPPGLNSPYGQSTSCADPN